MAINFPDTPTTGQSFTAAGRTWVYDGTTWNNDATAEFASVQFDTTAGVVAGVGEFAWNADQETMDLGLDENVTLQLGQEHVVRVKNASNTTAIPNGTFVMFAGAAGDTVTVAPAVTDGSVRHDYMVGVTTEEIPADGFGFVTQMGMVNEVDTAIWPVGTILYADPTTAGSFTATEPSAPNLKLPVAAVVKQGAGTSGKLLVRMDVGATLSDLHSVQLTSATSGEVLQYDGTKWVNSDVTVAEVTGLGTALALKVDEVNGAVTTADTFLSVVRNITISTSEPASGDGADGDVWMVYTP